MKIRRLLALAMFGAGWWVSLSALASTVAVAPIHDPGKSRGEGEALRKQIERGLADGSLGVVPEAKLLQAVSDQGFTAADLGKPAVLMPTAQAAGADAVLVATVAHKGKNEELEIHVYDLSGVELWTRSIPLKKGKLAPEIPAKIAKAVNAAIAAAPSSGGSSTTGSSGTDAVTSSSGSSDSGSSDSGNQTDNGNDSSKGSDKSSDDDSAKPVKNGRAIAAPAQTDDDALSKPQPKVHTKKNNEVKVADARGSKDGGASATDELIEGPPKSEREVSQPWPPYIDAGVGFTLTSRNYRLCPGVAHCSDSPPQPTADGRDVPVSYTTQTPYGGFSIWAEGFPLPKLYSINEDLTLTIGLMGEYAHSFTLTSRYQDPTTNLPAQFKSSEERVEASLTGRLYFHLLNGTGYAGLFGGLVIRKFAVDPNPLISESNRLGTGFGVNTEVPLVGNYLRLTARFTYMPALNPGVVETTLYGQTGRGGGFDIKGGLTSSFSYFGVSLLLDYTSLADTFAGAGTATTNGAVAEESYLTGYFVVHGRF
jgi:hypothetical protein